MTRSFPTRSLLLALDLLGGCFVIQTDTYPRLLDKIANDFQQTYYWFSPLLTLEKKKDFIAAPFCEDCDSVTLYIVNWF